jgi:reductive dehalogenase
MKMCARRIDKPRYEIAGKLEKFNEADNVQARGELLPDSELWQAYYKNHPELESDGRAWLKLPGMGNVGPIADRLMLASMFSTVGLISKDENVDGAPSPEKVELMPERAAAKIKGFARHLGADLVGIGPLNQAWVYSHVGRAHYPDQTIGMEIKLPHKSAIVVAVHLNRDMLRCAPEMPSVIEIIKTYQRLAVIAVTLAQYIRLLGYPARAHDIMNYQVLLVPLAIDAGLGELGRNGVLINEKYGNAIKMAAVTTDMPLAHDKPVNIGVKEFCKQCRICGEHCPVGAIPIKQEPKVVRGVRKWKINDAACYRYWRTVGTDCGICLAVCPWSRPRYFPHNIIQWGVERSALFRNLAIKADTMLKRKRNPCPSWLEEQPKEWQTELRTGHPFRC